MTRSPLSICRPLSLYCWVAILFSCSAEAFCRCASNWSGLLVEEPVLRLILVHLGPESLEGRKPERDYEAKDTVVVTGLPILGNSLWKESWFHLFNFTSVIINHLIFYFPDSTTLFTKTFISFSISRKSEKMPTAWTRKNGNCTWASVKKWGDKAGGPRIFISNAR